jgi:hypothetical protein
VAPTTRSARILGKQETLNPSKKTSFRICQFFQLMIVVTKILDGKTAVEPYVISMFFHQYHQHMDRPMLTMSSEIDCPTDKTHIEKLLVFVFLKKFVEFFDQFGRNEPMVGAAPAAKSTRSKLETRLFHRSFRLLHRGVQELLELLAQGRTLFPLCIFKPKRSERPIVPNVRSATSLMVVLNRPEQVSVPVCRLAQALAHVMSLLPCSFTSENGADAAIYAPQFLRRKTGDAKP